MKKSDIETKALKTYSNALRCIEDHIGKDITSDVQLNRLGKFLFADKWAGAVPSDVLCPVSEKKPYGITNTKPPPGEHWMGVCYEGRNKRCIYDSFGRKALTISHNPKILSNYSKICETDPDVEQDILENNCGQRCLAWLSVCAIDGLDAAKTI